MLVGPSLPAIEWDYVFYSIIHWKGFRLRAALHVQQLFQERNIAIARNLMHIWYEEKNTHIPYIPFIIRFRVPRETLYCAFVLCMIQFMMARIVLLNNGLAILFSYSLDYRVAVPKIYYCQYIASELKF